MKYEKGPYNCRWKCFVRKFHAHDRSDEGNEAKLRNFSCTKYSWFTVPVHVRTCRSTTWSGDLTSRVCMQLSGEWYFYDSLKYVGTANYMCMYYVVRKLFFSSATQKGTQTVTRNTEFTWYDLNSKRKKEIIHVKEPATATEVVSRKIGTKANQIRQRKGYTCT